MHSYDQAEIEYQQALEMHQQHLTEKVYLNDIRADLVMNQALNLFKLGKYEESIQKYSLAWDIHTDYLMDRKDLHEARADLLKQQGQALCVMGNVIEGINKFIKAWQIYQNHLKNRPDLMLQLNKLILIWQQTWDYMEDPQAWAEEISTDLRNRLDQINLSEPPDSLQQIYEDFNEFHLFWMHKSLEANDVHKLIYILNRISSWRMANAILDELETINLSKNNNKDILVRYQNCRFKLRNLLQRIHEMEHLARYEKESNLNFSGQVSQVFDSIEHTMLVKEIDNLKITYNTEYLNMLDLQQQVSELPSYQAVLASRTDFNAKDYQEKLSSNQAILVIFDQNHSNSNDKPNYQQPIYNLNGAILIKEQNVVWIPIEEMLQGRQLFNCFEYLIRNTKSRGIYRVDTFDPNILNDETLPLTYHNEIITENNLWDFIGDWIYKNLWLKLKEELRDIENLILATQGNISHVIPWHVNSPISKKNITRLPGLMFAAMHLNIMQQPETQDTKRIGVSYYNGQQHPLPLASVEADVISKIWQDNQPIVNFDLPTTAIPVGKLHIAGHGNHSDNLAQTASLSVGDNTQWHISQIMASPCHPKQVYISCCLAGKTTDNDLNPESWTTFFNDF